MPVTVSYPGVYIEELSSGVHTITGVATSIAAFVGWADEGPTNEAVLVESWSDFESQFGGLTYNGAEGAPNYLGYAVNQFFANGGQQAYIVRLVWTDAVKGQANIPADAVAFLVTPMASVQNPGSYGVQITAGSTAGQFSLALYQVTGGTQSQIGSTLSGQTLSTIQAAVSGDATLSKYIQIQNVASSGTPVPGSSSTALYLLAATSAGFRASIPAAPTPAFTVQAAGGLTNPNSYGVQITPGSTTGQFNLALYQVSGGTQTVIGSPLNGQTLATIQAAVSGDATLSTYIQIQNVATAGLPIPNPPPALLYMLGASGSNSVNVPSASTLAFTAQAADEGAWSASYGVRIAGSPFDPTRFTLLVINYNANGLEQVVETFPNLSNNSYDPQFVQSVINDPNTGSSFIQIVPGSSTGNVPLPNPNLPSPAAVFPPYPLVGGADGTVLAPDDANFLTALNATQTTVDSQGLANGVFYLDRVSIFNLLCVPGLVDPTTIQLLQAFCYKRRAFLIADSDPNVSLNSLLQNGPNSLLTGANAMNSAVYFPWTEAPDPLNQNRITQFPPSGFVAGIYAATDASRGVWKAPAGIDASLTGVSGLQYNLTDQENGTLNVQAINCLREFKVYGDVVWGARTLQGNDQAGSQWKYIPIRRLALFLESSLYNGTQWVVFEPNDEPLWGQIRLNVGAFMQGLFLQGAFQGTTPQQAYFVKCDSENNPQSSIDLGIVNILVGFAPLYPAEFVIIQIQQMAGQLQS